MELRELQERIQRWKQKGQSPEGEESAPVRAEDAAVEETEEMPEEESVEESVSGEEAQPRDDETGEISTEDIEEEVDDEDFFN